MKLINISNISYGIPAEPVEIPGYEIIAKEGEFLKAKRGGNTFYVGIGKKVYYLALLGVFPDGREYATDFEREIPK